MERENNAHLNWPWIVGLALLPLVIAGLYIGYANIQNWFRYDEAYFTPTYAETYDAPFAATSKLERVLQTGDAAVYAELTGLRRLPPVPEPNPKVVYAILLEVDEKDYFHYMYFNPDTYERLIYYLKEVKGRWVVVPQDAYFYYDSGQWLKLFLPVSFIYWPILLIATVAVLVFRATSRVRGQVFGS